MRQLSRLAALVIVSFGPLLAQDVKTPKPPYAPGTTDPIAKPTTGCSLIFTHQYPNSSCSVSLTSEIPGSPLPVAVPKGTTVQIKVKRRSNFEIIQFTQSIDAVASPDFGLALVKLFLPNITSMSIRTQPSSLLAAHDIPDAIELEQISIAGTLDSIVTWINARTDAINDWKAGKKPKIGSTCDAEKDETKKFACYQNAFNTALDPKLTRTLPAGPIAALDSIIAAAAPLCYKETDISKKAEADAKKTHNQKDEEAALAPKFDEQRDCYSTIERHEQDQAQLKSALADVSAKMDSLVALRKAIAALPAPGDFIDDLTPQTNKKVTVKIVSKDALGSTTTDLGSVVVTWQGSNFSLSAGILASTMASRSFANGPVYVDGAPEKDQNNNTVYAVTETDTRPSFVTPLALLNYELPFGYSQSGRFGIAISGGLGANLTNKTADYVLGPSLRCKDLLFTPALHYGRDTTLAGGIYVGDPSLGTASSVPTQQHFHPHFGLALTYRSPVP